MGCEICWRSSHLGRVLGNVGEKGHTRTQPFSSPRKLCVVQLWAWKQNKGVCRTLFQNVPLCFSSVTDVAKALQKVRYSGETELLGPRVQDQREARNPLHHRPLHQFRDRHDPPLGPSPAALDRARGGSPVPAEFLIQSSEHLQRWSSKEFYRADEF